MAQQTMRGIRLGAQSLESEVGVSYSPRTKHSYQCANGHVSELVFAQDAELPSTWQCKSCPSQATLITDGKLIKLDIDELKNPRTHWEMLLERRSTEELEEILKERITYIRARRKAGKADV
jgi:peptide subunit release factor 1 (eRF1)